MDGRIVLACLLAALTTAVAAAAPAPNGGRLLYLRPLGGNEPPWSRLFVSAADGTGVKDITPAGLHDVQNAAWSPDGRRIAISAIAANDHDPEIFISSADGTHLRMVTNNHLSDRQPTWSPDGRRIAFTWMPDGANQELFVMRRNGTGVRQITATNGVIESGPDWQR